MSLNVPMLRHQKLALAWMCRREQSHKVSGGILADDQGLGKTVTTIALLLTHMPGGDYLHATHNSQADGEGNHLNKGNVGAEVGCVAGSRVVTAFMMTSLGSYGSCCVPWALVYCTSFQPALHAYVTRAFVLQSCVLP